MHGLRIVVTCVLGAVTFGIIHDQVTARVCIEYFTVGHPRILDSDDPTLLALVWGFLATWWVGILLGVSLALAARNGPRPKVDSAALVRPVAGVLAVTAVGALLAGLAGWFGAERGLVVLPMPLGERVPPGRHVAFVADLWAHGASYALGFIGGGFLVVRTWRSRIRATPQIRRPSG